MTGEVARASSPWLALREPADAAARAGELVEELRGLLPGAGTLEVHDLGSGTGSMARWLAPRLDGPQRWLLHDRDGELLDQVPRELAISAADGAPVTTEGRRDDVTRLADELGAAGLVTASALLDMLTDAELRRLVVACDRPGCPVLVTLSVVGVVELEPPDPLDDDVRAAFNDHQRRSLGGARLLGPDAVAAAATAFEALGREVVVRPSPWRLGPATAALLAEWFTGWWDAARDQRPELASIDPGYRDRRLAACRDGGLRATVHHQDLLVRPAGRGPRTGG